MKVAQLLKMISQLSHGMHTKKLRQIREKSDGGPKLIDENNFTIKKHKKREKGLANYPLVGIMLDPFYLPKNEFF